MTASLQISSKLPDGRIFVVGGDGIDAFEQNLKAIVGDEKAQDILGEMAASLSGAGTVSQAVQNLQNGLGATVDHTAHPVSNANVAPVSRTCTHGVMTPRTGSGAKGPWKGYFCPSPKGTPDQCSPIFVQRNDPAWGSL
jgi:hypothetical protein